MQLEKINCNKSYFFCNDENCKKKIIEKTISSALNIVCHFKIV